MKLYGFIFEFGDIVTTIFLIIMAIVSYIFYNNEKLRSGLPAFITVLGVLGTFVGIFIGLLYFDVENIDESVPQLLEGLKISFTTSIAGIILALIFRYLNASNAEMGDDDNFANLFLRTLNKIQNSNERIFKSINDGINELKHTLGGDSDTSILTQLIMLRTVTTDKNDELINEFKDFANTMSESNTKTFIQALEEVIREFNVKITEQFGENFKELNQAVGKLLQWQENYKEQVELVVQQITTTSDAIDKNQKIIKTIGDTYNRSFDVTSKLEVLITSFNQHEQELATNLNEFKKLADSVTDVFPAIETNITNLTTNFSKSVEDSVQNIENSISEQKQQMTQNSEELSAAYQDSINQLITLQNKIAEDTASNLEKIDAALGDELNKSLNSLGDALATLSNKFVEDYTPLTDKLKDLIEISKTE